MEAEVESLSGNRCRDQRLWDCAPCRHVVFHAACARQRGWLGAGTTGWLVATCSSDARWRKPGSKRWLAAAVAVQHGRAAPNVEQRQVPIRPALRPPNTRNRRQSVAVFDAVLLQRRRRVRYGVLADVLQRRKPAEIQAYELPRVAGCGSGGVIQVASLADDRHVIINWYSGVFFSKV